MSEGETADTSDPSSPSHPRRARWRRVVAALSLLVVGVCAGLWTARKPIAEHFVDDALRARGVPAQYAIARIGFRTQRLTDVRIGDPAHPDLLADWIEVDTSLWSGATVRAIRAGSVRVRARLVGKAVSFGTIDRLLPAPSGKPFALPAIHAEIADARIALATAAGDVALRIRGAGRLDDGFAGTIAATTPRVAAGGCEVERVAALLRVAIVRARPSVAGPVTVARAVCGGTQIAQARADVRVALGEALDHWKGDARLAVAMVAVPGGRVRAVVGPVAFVGSPRDVSGTIDLATGPFAAAGMSGTSGAVAGRYRYAGGFAFAGRVRGMGVRPPAAMLEPLRRWQGAGAGTPVAPVAQRIVAALAAAGRSGDVSADLSALSDGGRGQVTVSRLGFAAASGARVGLRGVSYRWPDAGVRIDGDATVAGGGLPSMQARLTQTAPGAPLVGRVVMAPYAAGASRLALTPIAFTARADAATHVVTRATLSGPLADGRVEALSVPLEATWDGDARLTVDPGCVPLSFDRLRAAGLDVARSAVTLCPLDGALVRLERGVLRGGGSIGPVRLGGTLGASPLELTARRAAWRLGERSFALTGLGVRLGTAERMTRLDVPMLDGRFAGGGAWGTFTGAGGRIGSVPLLLSAADGQWRFAKGVLALEGAMTVADTAADPRFVPLAARAVALTLANGRIAARGTLFEPEGSVKVADVALAHDLGSGSGSADLTVPGITFGERFQPDRLTRLTYGVIANVAGSVNGAGHVRWSPRGVTSDGVFRTRGIDLAAAFGPATGIAGEVRFTDLLALETAPGQVATVKSINPGIAVTDGTIRYQLLPNARIAVEQGRWPFAGGTLTLAPTVLDFGEARERRMTFGVAGMEAAKFLQQFDFKNLDATGVFDGTLPMIFDARGGRIENGQLVVRQGGGTIAYVGELSQKDIGVWGNFAFQALKSLRYRNLGVVMNGPLAGEMVTEVRFAGVGQGVGAKRNFILDRLQKLPLVFNVRIAAPFRQLVDTAQSFYDPKRLIERNLPALLEEREKRAGPPVQPPESGHAP